MVRFAQEVGEREAEIEGRVAEVDDFVIEQDEALAMDKDVLGAVIAMYKGEAGSKRVLDEHVQEMGSFGDLLDGVPIIGFYAQGDEERVVVEDGCDLFALEVGVPVDCA